MSAAAIKLDLPKYDGTGGPSAALRFIKRVDRAQTAGNLSNARVAAAIAQNLSGAAETWFEAQGTLAALDSWDTLKPMIRGRFATPMTVNEIRAMHATLVQKANEATADFRDRCTLAMNNEDIGLTDDIKAEAGYESNLARRLKRAFLGGLRQEVRAAMVGVDPEAATIEELVRLARNAENLARSAMGPTAPIAEVAVGTEEISALEAAIEAVLTRRYGPAGGRGRGGGGGGAGYTPRPGPKKDLPGLKDPGYADREKKICGRCGKMGKHRAHECVVDLEKKKQRESRTNANAMSKTGEAEGADGFQDYGLYEDPLNG
jgi:hypothetical protein